MPWLVNDWISSTTRKMMSHEEQGIYFLLLNHAWNDPDCCLPSADDKLARIAELTPQRWKKVRDIILGCFKEDINRQGFIFNHKQRAERHRQLSRINSAQDHARNAAKSRWAKRNGEHCSSNAQAMPEHSPSNAQAMPEVMPEAMLKNASSPVSPLSSPVTHKKKSTEEATPLVSEVAVCHEIAAYWNTKPGISHVGSLSPARLKKIKTRLTEPFFREYWKAAIDRIANSDFCIGKGERGWKADIDWFLKPDTAIRVIEGKYDNKTNLPGAEKERTSDFW